jgi:hypothetical protein
MTTLNPESEDHRKEWDWSLPPDLPLPAQLAHRVACDIIDNCTDREELRKCAKSYHALYKKTQHVWTIMANQEFGFPTNIDGV